MKNLLNINSDTYTCPCGKHNGCKTVAEMHICTNVRKEEELVLIFPSKINKL